jgi:serine/threonine protein kinase
MDKHKATELEKFLAGEVLEGYEIQRLINFGKSAAVFEGAHQDGSKVAIKIFDSELIDKFGAESQQRRIEQEQALKGHDIKGLVKILGGGDATVKGNPQYFLIMELISGQNLKEFIANENYDEPFVRSVLASLFEVSEALMKMAIAHRDIKPENIMVSATGEIILMDLGVVKLIGTPSETDVDEPQFLGTLRYAPPEYLRRQEADTPAGWKAVNLYQIGAVLHDLIMKTELFHDRSPYANIVIAVKEDVPTLDQGFFGFDLVQLARDMLIKNPEQRLSACPDDRIKLTMHPKAIAVDTLDWQLEKLKQLTSPYITKLQAIEDVRRSAQDRYKKRKSTLDLLTKAVNNTIGTLKSKQVFTNYSTSNDFQEQAGLHPGDVLETNRLLRIDANISKGLPFPLFLLIHEEANENDYVKLDVAGFAGNSLTASNVSKPAGVISQLPQNSTRGFRNAGVVMSLPKLKEMFSGILQKTSDIEPHLTSKFMSLILAAIAGLKPITDEELSWQEDLAKGNARNRIVGPYFQYFYCE